MFERCNGGLAIVTTTYRQALHDGLYDTLKSNPKSFLMGEDVARYGGTYAVSKDLLEQFSEERIRDTPLSESVFTGAGIGAALGGMLPIVEIMTCNFVLLALDQIINNAATLHHMSGGQINIPLVIRISTGAGRQLAAQHSHSWEGWLAHIPGIKIISPATVTDARYMLQAAILEKNPTILFEQAALYNDEGELEQVRSVNLNKAQVVQEGSDVTLISYGASLKKCLIAAKDLKDINISAEIIDLRILRPLDNETIYKSVIKTHRVVIVDEGWKSGSLSAEISARINNELFYELDAPIQRVCTAEVPIPYARHLEEQLLPSVSSIISATLEILNE